MRTVPSRVLMYVLAALFVIPPLIYLNHRLAVASPGGVDFLTHWIGTRALFHGESPYSNDVAVRVQKFVYGRPALQGENEFLDPYMLHMETIFAPFALIPDYTLARTAWMTFLELVTVAIFLISLRIVDWKPKIPTLGIYMLYAVLGYHSVRPIINGNVTTVITLIIVSAVWAIKKQKDYIAGILMAFAFAKPNLTVVPLLFLIVWTISVKRWRFVAWFAGSLAVLVLAGMLIIPDWPLQNLSNILRYSAYNPPTTVASALNDFLPGLGRWIGVAVYAVVSVVLIREWMKALGKDFSIFLAVFSLTLVLTQWLWISTDPGNFIILTLPLALVLKSIDERRNGSLWVLVLLSVLLIGLWALFLTTFDPSRGNLQSPIMFFPLPLVLLIGLFLGRRQPPSSEGIPLPA